MLLTLSKQTYLICIQEYHKNSMRSQSTLVPHYTVYCHYTLPTQSLATNQAHVELTLINVDIGTKWILTVWGEIGKSGSCQESNPNTWLVQPVVCHWAATTRQPQTLTIFYMYCTGRTPGSHWVSAVRTSLGVDWKFYSVYFSLFNWENHSAWAFCWWRGLCSLTRLRITVWLFRKVFFAKFGDVTLFGATKTSNPQKSYFSQIRNNFLPQKFPANTYIFSSN